MNYLCKLSKIVFRCRIDDLGLTPSQVYHDIKIARTTLYRMAEADTKQKRRIFIDSAVTFQLMRYYKLSFGDLYEIYEWHEGNRGNDRLGTEVICQEGKPYPTKEIVRLASQIQFYSRLRDKLSLAHLSPQQLFDHQVINRNTFYFLAPERPLNRIDSETATNLMLYFNCHFFDLFEMRTIS